MGVCSWMDFEIFPQSDLLFSLISFPYFMRKIQHFEDKEWRNTNNMHWRYLFINIKKELVKINGDFLNFGKNMYVICPQKRHVIFYISSIPFRRKMEENIQEYMSLYLLDLNITENNTKRGKVFWFCPKSWGNDEKSPYVSIFREKIHLRFCSAYKSF